MSNDDKISDADIDGLVRRHDAEGQKIPGSAVFLLCASWLMYAIGTVALLLTPFWEQATLLNAVCFFVIGACISVFYIANVMDDMKTGHARHVRQSRLLREIRDAISNRPKNE